MAREEGAESGRSNMNDESHSPAQGTRPDEQASSRGLAALSRLTFDDSDVGEIFREATAVVDGLASCRVEASYRSVNGGFVRFHHPSRHTPTSNGTASPAGMATWTQETAGGGGRSR